MSKTAQKITELGLILPAPMLLPPGVTLPFPLVNIRGNRAFISGHGPLNVDGSLKAPFGKVGVDVSVEQANALAGDVALSILSNLTDALGDLDRITGWGKILGMVNSAPGFNRQPDVINGFTDIILAVFGPDIGRHARSAVGVASLPFDIAVEIEGEVEISN